MINILFFFMCLVASTTSHRFDGIQSTLKEDLELERKLKLINKPPVKSIHTKFGYIVDCIDINKQPAFDHPLLKNHNLQRKPSFQNTIRKTTSVKISPTKPKFGLEKDQCPTGTVPIRRTTKDDLIRGQLFFNNHMLKGTSGDHVAEVTLVTAPGFPYYGVSGTNSIYNPKAQNDQSSTSIMWVRNGPMDNTNKIAVGWHVAPQLYNDDATHLFATWTRDNFKSTGCFNLQCPGFVQTSKTNYLGERYDNTSVYGGLMIEETFSIFQDPESKHWWLNIENESIGYFPASLFSNLTFADQVGWGGRTTTSVGAPSPPMGSGYFPDGNFIHACYFKYVTFQNDSRKNYGPEEYMARTLSDKPSCFGVEYYGDAGEEKGYSLQFGGPGGQCDD